jgi:hypothetical protein
MTLVFMASIAAMDSEKMWIPITAFFVSGAWLLIYAFVLDSLRNRKAGKHYAVSHR